MAELKKCMQCGNDFESKRRDSKFCSRVCADKWTRTHKGVSRKTLEDAPNPKKIAASPPIPKSQISKGGNSALDVQLAVDLKAIKKRIAQELIRICQNAIKEALEEAFA